MGLRHAQTTCEVDQAFLLMSGRLVYSWFLGLPKLVHFEMAEIAMKGSKTSAKDKKKEKKIREDIQKYTTMIAVLRSSKCNSNWLYHTNI